MNPFTPRTSTLRGSFPLSVGIEDAFPLFSPAGEKVWAPGWNPELIHPAGSKWEEGQIFRTQEESGEAIWLVRRLDYEKHIVEYCRIEPGRYVANIEVSCRSLPDKSTVVSTSYSYIGLSEAGNKDIDAWTQQAYDEKMSHWKEWIDRYLSSR